MIDPKLAGTVVLVTGANNPAGIGAATARAFAAQEALLLLTWHGLPGPETTLSSLRAMGARVEAVEVDLSDPSAVPHLFDRAEKALGPVEVLVCNAAHSRSDTFLPLGPDGRDWAGRPTATISAGSHDAHFGVNSRATALLIAEYARRHAARAAGWGRVITVSTDGAPGFPDEVSYGASKAALESYSRAAALELGRFGITVNIVSPGPTQTGWMTREMEKRIGRDIPLGRVGRPEDVADVILFLASDQARWLTGQTIHVGGGHRMI